MKTPESLILSADPKSSQVSSESCYSSPGVVKMQQTLCLTEVKKKRVSDTAPKTLAQSLMNLKGKPLLLDDFKKLSKALAIQEPKFV